MTRLSGPSPGSRGSDTGQAATRARFTIAFDTHWIDIGTGFRTGYEDLIRIWTTDGIAQWFVELALVEESLRDSITALNKAGRRPDEMAIRMRAHSELLLTSKNKSKMLEDDARTWSGGNPQTILFPLHDGDALARNLDIASALLRQHPPTHDAHGGATCNSTLNTARGDVGCS